MSVPRTPFALFVVAIAASGQSSASAPQFEVASIDLATVSTFGMSPARGARTRIDSGRVEFLGTTLPNLIRTAYRLEPYQNVTGPDWMKKTYFDVFATLPKGAPRSQVPEMLQALLATQLKLVLRRESRDEGVCFLTVGKNGPKLKPVPADFTPTLYSPHSDNRTPVLRSKVPSGYLTYSRVNGAVVLDAPKISMADLATALRRELNVPVFDRTGLEGFYEVSLFVPGTQVRAGRSRPGFQDDPAPAPTESPEVPVAPDPEGVNLYRSIQRLGLKLEKSKAPIEHLIVESADQNPAGHANR